MIFKLFEESYKLLSSAKCPKKVRIFPTTSFTYVKNNSGLRPGTDSCGTPEY